MKSLIMIVSASLKQDIVDRLRTLPEVGGFTLTVVEGHGAPAERDTLSARDRVVGHVPRLRLELLVTDADAVLAALRDIGGGQGTYWVMTVEGYGRL